MSRTESNRKVRLSDYICVETLEAVQEYVESFFQEISYIESFFIKHLSELTLEFKNIESQIEFKSLGDHGHSAAAALTTEDQQKELLSLHNSQKMGIPLVSEGTINIGDQIV